MSEIAGMSQSKRPHIIVITGGIATGKSAVTSYIKSKGYEVLDCDEIVHNGYETQSELFHSVINCFGQVVLGENGYIDRKKLSNIVLSKDELLETLNGLVHKYVIDELMECVTKSTAQKIFLDIPLMFEHKEILENLGLVYDEIWLVYVTPEIQKKRLINRANMENKDISQVLKILDKQIPIDTKKSLADRIIYNNGTLEELYDTINKILI